MLIIGAGIPQVNQGLQMTCSDSLAGNEHYKQGVLESLKEEHTFALRLIY